jgi:hypothetical protein
MQSPVKTERELKSVMVRGGVRWAEKQKEPRTQAMYS